MPTVYGDNGGSAGYWALPIVISAMPGAYKGQSNSEWPVENGHGYSALDIIADASHSNPVDNGHGYSALDIIADASHSN